MRVVSGTFRGRTISAPEGFDTRPTTDRVRESLFNVLAHGPYLPGGFEEARVLDLFAGTGALGIEALSRGAKFALFVEQAVEARAAVRRNIETLGLTGRTRVFRRDATKLGDMPGNAGGPFNLVFLDPPYGKDLGVQALKAAIKGSWLADEVCIAYEMSSDEPDPNIEGFTVADVKTYGDTKVVVFLTLCD